MYPGRYPDIFVIIFSRCLLTGASSSLRIRSVATIVAQEATVARRDSIWHIMQVIGALDILSLLAVTSVTGLLALGRKEGAVVLLCLGHHHGLWLDGEG